MSVALTKIYYNFRLYMQINSSKGLAAENFGKSTFYTQKKLETVWNKTLLHEMLHTKQVDIFHRQHLKFQTFWIFF